MSPSSTPEWEDQQLPGLDNVPTDETKRKRPPAPIKEGVARWARFLPNTFNCCQCLSTANLRREDSEGFSYWCFLHGSDQKLVDKKAGLWDSK